ncbi:hypothetical protein CBE37_00520 [bacterium TMED277]|nr:MAG: hypothetical protein CBE37_00520 [bacterium TMED277]
MFEKKYHVSAIGNAMLDVVCEVSDDFLAKEDILKGNMQLISQERSMYLLNLIDPIKKTAGGSAANTVSTLSKLGLRTSYIGKVANDKEGSLFHQDLISQNVNYKTKTLSSETPLTTGKCIVMVTSDKERTMNTYLGATELLDKEDIDTEIIQQSEWLYLEGYRFDGKESIEAFYKAIDIAKKYNTKIALSLSDSFCVDRHRSEFLNLIKRFTDILFCNKDELKSLYQVNEIRKAFSKCKNDVPITACTADEKGVYVINHSQEKIVPTERVNVIDSTGAGDSFAAGFLYGIVNNKDLHECSIYGNKIASEVLKVYGPRIEINLDGFFES